VEEAEKEPEDTHKSYADYLAEQAAKRMEGLGVKEARAPNEGAKDNKWKSAKELNKEEEEAAYFQGKEDKARRERDRTRNAKERLADFTYNVADADSAGQRGGRGRGRGRGERGEYRGRGERGEYRGRGRGDRDRDGEGFRGRGEGYRGRGDRGDRGDRGEYRGRGRGRGGRDGSGQIPAVPFDDESAFPSLGGSK
jgi:plasminogen activator inhibitor 1 RNA-binding protein